MKITEQNIRDAIKGANADQKKLMEEAQQQIEKCKRCGVEKTPENTRLYRTFDAYCKRCLKLNQQEALHKENPAREKFYVTAGGSVLPNKFLDFPPYD